MKLTVFFAKDGDCLLLTSGDGKQVLVDGGRSSSFEAHTRPVLQALADAGARLDLVCVSHIDADHISGVITLLEDLAAWSVFDFQVGEGQNPGFPQPNRPRPPEIGALWHNSWRAQFGDLAGPINAVATHIAEAVELAPEAASGTTGAGRAALDSVVDLAESIAHGIRLVRLVEDDTPLTRNKGFPNGLVLLRNPAHREPVGSMTLTVLGPTRKHLTRLREEWEDWLNRHPRSVVPDKPRARRGGAADPGLAPADGPATMEEAADVIADLATAAEVIEKSNAAGVTPPNRASITMLAEEDPVSVLLTGDAAEDEILEGLTSAGLLTPGGPPFRCTVLKVQHHGSEFNLSKGFTDRVLADHYVFCGDGAHDNPSPSVVKTIVTSRLQAEGPFTLWFNCSEQRTLPQRRKAMRAALQEARRAAARHTDRIEVRVLEDDRSFLEIQL